MKYILSLMVVCFVAIPNIAMAERKKCVNFSTQKAAQAWYEKQKNAGRTGWKSLDRDGDGKACDCLPGGSGKNCPR